MTCIFMTNITCERALTYTIHLSAKKNLKINVFTELKLHYNSPRMG